MTLIADADVSANAVWLQAINLGVLTVGFLTMVWTSLSARAKDKRDKAEADRKAREIAAAVAEVAAKAATAARKVEVVADKLDESTAAVSTKLEGLAKLGAASVAIGEKSDRSITAVHTLVNSATGAQLKLNAVVSRRLADLTGAAGDGDAALIAEDALASHMARQKVVDEESARPTPGNPAGGKPPA